MVIKHITPREWDKVEKAGAKAVEGIPLTHCRVYQKRMARAEIEEINIILTRKRPLTNAEMVGRECKLVKVENYNLGNSTYPDMYIGLNDIPIKISRLTNCTVYGSNGIWEVKHRNVIALIW